MNKINSTNLIAKLIIRVELIDFFNVPKKNFTKLKSLFKFINI